MQTIQASRTYMMCARDKVVDLGEYRRSLADCWSVPTQAPAEPRVLPVPVPISRPRRRSSRLRRKAVRRTLPQRVKVEPRQAAEKKNL